MEKPASPSDSPPPRAPGGRRTFLRVVTIVSGVLLLAAILLVLVTSLTERNVVWLTPAQFGQHTKAGPFTPVKQKLKEWTAPIWRRFRRPAPLIRIDSHLLTLSSTALEHVGLHAPATTNPDGMRAWILTPAESELFQLRIQTNAGVAILSSPTVQTGHGGPARIGAGGSPYGIIVDLVPKARSGSIRMTVSASVTEKPDSPTQVAIAQTNYAVACQAIIPNGGCLFLESGPPKTAAGKRFGMIISPTTVDAQGKPIKR